MGVASLVIGIIALIFSLIPLLGAFAIGLAIPGGLLGIAQIIFTKKSRALAVAGVVLSVLAGGISCLQFKLVEKVEEGLNSLEKGRIPEISTKTQNETKLQKSKKEPLKLHGVYKIRNDNVNLLVCDFENTTDKDIKVFRGKILYFDDFDKIENAQEVTFKKQIPAKGRLVIASLSDPSDLSDLSGLSGLSNSGQKQIITAKSVGALPAEIAFAIGMTGKVENKVEFRTTDIRYIEK